MIDNLLKQSHSARSTFIAQNQKLLQNLAHHGQRPQALFIGCADSRVVPEALFGLQPGDFFMLRNIANVMPPYIQSDTGTVAVLEYAVNHLKVPHIIVCGHTECGGIQGLDTHLDMIVDPALSRWLNLVRDAKRDVDFSSRDLSPEERHYAIVERNVVNQLENLKSYPIVREMIAQQKLELHGWVYYLKEMVVGYWDTAVNQFINSTQ